jgi:alpha-L-arabinofuranosidase
MKKIALLICLFCMFNCKSFSQTITVNTASVIKTFDHNPAAINLNYLMDDDNYLNPVTPLSQSLINMKIGVLRYPGGEKADNYLWSVAPYTSANPHFATQGNCNWPNNQPDFSSDYISPLSTTMDFDELMTLCSLTGAKPLIVVAGDAHYNTWCTNPPTLSDLITNAVEWVKYANLTKQYNIKYWVVGNESFNSAAYGAPSTPLQYANDFIQFATAMKAVDSTITVVANSKSGVWVNTLIQNAGGYVDAIAISNYPNYNWINGYDTYRNGNPSFVSDIDSVMNASGNSVKIIVAEYNSIDWNNAWPNDNDLGHALVNFQMFGDQIKIERVEDAFLWNTRWINNVNNPQNINDAIDSSGNLNATGKALAMWGNNMLDKMVYSSNSGYINSFAMTDSSGTYLNIFLINKDYSSHQVTINLNNYPLNSAAELTISESKLSGLSVVDKFPQIASPLSPAAMSDSSITLQIDPLSIHVVRLESYLVTSLENKLATLPNVTIYPNPANDRLTIQFEKPLLESTELKVINSVGTQVYCIKTMAQKTIIDFSAFPSGIYLISANTYKKIIIK